ncbi:MAG: fumarylacetoacetate hydrolase family protein [Acidobacteriota bacterium]
MKLTVFKDKSKAGLRVGAFVSDSQIVDFSHLVSDASLDETAVMGCFDLETDFLSKAASAVTDAEIIIDRSSVEFLSPVPAPRKIICIGLNYRDHAEESGMAIPKSPIMFSKFTSCVIGPGAAIIVPGGSTELDYEAELAFVIGHRSKNVAKANALGHVFGYVNFNDVSARDFQFADGQWQRGKSCDTFAPMGEYVATADEIPDPQDLSIRLRLNGETMQDSTTAQMIFGVAELIEFLSRFITLEPGDVIATGTPPGVGFARKPPIYMKDGDVVEVEIAGLGVLSNPVRAAK